MIHKNIKRFTGNFTWLFLFNNLGYVFSLITFPILISKYGLVEMGVVFTIQSLVLTLTVLSNYSLTFYLPSVTKQIKLDSHFAQLIWHKILSVRFYFSCLLGFISIGVVYFYYPFYLVYWLFSLPILLAKIINPNLICNAIENNKYILLISLFSKGLFLIFVLFSTNSLWINFFLGITEFIIILFFLPKIDSNIFKYKIVSLSTLFPFLKQTFNLFLVTIFSILKPASILPSISFFLGSEYATLYTLADKIINYIRGISGSAFVSYYPIYNEHKNEFKLFKSSFALRFIIISGVSVVLFYLVAPLIIYLLNNFEHNKLATKTLQILCLSIPMFFMIIPLFSYLLEHKKWNNIVVFAIIQLVLMLLSIYFFHINIKQIAIGFVITEYVLLFCYLVNVYLLEKRKGTIAFFEH